MSGTTKSLGAKDALDKFYTKPAVAARCLEALDLPAYTRIIEPSAGGGAFSDLLFDNRRLRKVHAFDLAPENSLVTQQDWFTFKSRERSKTLVVGNPPFGRQSALAIRFINHAFEVVGGDTVAFVLPRGFRKESVQQRVWRYAHLVEEIALTQNAFTLHGYDYSLPAVFQIWRRATMPRPAASPLSSTYAEFTRKQVTHDLVVRRVGGRAGTAFPAGAEASEQSNYSLRLIGAKKPPVRDVVGLINQLVFAEARNGTGPNSLSKRELVRRFDSAYRERFSA